MENKIEKLTKKIIENLTRKQAFYYVKKLGVKNVPNELIYKLSGWQLIEYAESLNFKNVRFIIPKNEHLLFDEFSKNNFKYYNYFMNLNLTKIVFKAFL